MSPSPGSTSSLFIVLLLPGFHLHPSPDTFRVRTQNRWVTFKYLKKEKEQKQKKREKKKKKMSIHEVK